MGCCHDMLQEQAGRPSGLKPLHLRAVQSLAAALFVMDFMQVPEAAQTASKGGHVQQSSSPASLAGRHDSVLAVVAHIQRLRFVLAYIPFDCHRTCGDASVIAGRVHAAACMFHLGGFFCRLLALHVCCSAT